MRGRLLSVPLTACLLLTGCAGLPYPREMGDMALLRTMGVDRAGEELSVTVSTGPRARGLQGEQEPALVLSARGSSLAAAALSLQSLSDSYVYFGYVDQLLLGEELARRGVTAVLDYFARDVELGLGAQLWVVRESTARGAVESGGGQGVDSRLSTLQTDGEMGVAAIPRTAGEVYTDLLEQGCAYLPALVPGDGEGAVLLDGGYAVLKGETLAGYLDGEAARGLELLAGRPAADILGVRLPSGWASARITGGDVQCQLRFEAGMLVGYRISCRLTARPAEYAAPLTQGDLELLQAALERRERARLLAALEQLRAWGTDCTGLGPRGALSDPAGWQSAGKDWQTRFAALEPELQLRVSLQE